MLVLGRRVGEDICLGDDIVVTVKRISGNRVSLGIQAPKDTKILRGEIKMRTPESCAGLDDQEDETKGS